ncbi:uncharacterized protein N7518_002479 [Penicillium psychrosexuale]|uniref:uncharacterized protein n=1 Tax=Penicillium psychrosexuale TaxID=1002107 RepID=UPI0025456D5C|nr:uncharacterized protein N7518_002479 [Penicillium psychrosexuale]KAJ5800411.1 hypothetical protein N7518_002479 [Penicillium psychrosexuale]
MDALVPNLQVKVASLTKNVNKFVKNKDVIDGTNEIQKLVRAASVKINAPELLSVAVTSLKLGEIAGIFHLTPVAPDPGEPSLGQAEIVHAPNYLIPILSDYDLVTNSSPASET